MHSFRIQSSLQVNQQAITGKRSSWNDSIGKGTIKTLPGAKKTFPKIETTIENKMPAKFIRPVQSTFPIPYFK